MRYEFNNKQKQYETSLGARDTQTFSCVNDGSNFVCVRRAVNHFQEIPRSSVAMKAFGIAECLTKADYRVQVENGFVRSKVKTIEFIYKSFG